MHWGGLREMEHHKRAAFGRLFVCVPCRLVRGCKFAVGPGVLWVEFKSGKKAELYLRIRTWP